jgi:hypothetical protein
MRLLLASPRLAVASVSGIPMWLVRIDRKGAFVVDYLDATPPIPAALPQLAMEWHLSPTGYRYVERHEELLACFSRGGVIHFWAAWRKMLWAGGVRGALEWRLQEGAAVEELELTPTVHSQATDDESSFYRSMPGPMWATSLAADEISFVRTGLIDWGEERFAGVVSFTCPPALASPEQ